MKRSESIKEIASALSKAQGQIEGAKKDTPNPFYKSKFADLDSCRDAMRKPFADNGLSLTQNVFSKIDNGNEKLFLSALLMHSSGEWIEYDEVFCGTKDASPQSAKSSITLMRRTQLLAVAGMSEADDDGNQASVPNNQLQNQPPAQGPYTQSLQKKPIQNFAPKGT